MVLASREELKKGVEEVVTVMMSGCRGGKGSSDYREYWLEKREGENWMDYVNRIGPSKYLYGLSYENGC